MKNKKKKNELTLFQWKNHTIDEMIEVHKNVMFRKTHVLTNLDKCCVCIGKPEPEKWEEIKPQVKVNESILRVKYMYLSHLIIARCLSNEEYCNAEFNSYILKAIFGNQYQYMLLTLWELGLIHTAGNYSIKIYSEMGESYPTSYGLSDSNVTRIKTKNFKILGYHSKLKGILNQIGRYELPSDIKRNYSKVLDKLVLDDVTAIDYVNNHYKDNEVDKSDTKKDWRLYRIDSFYEQDEPKCDSNGRIYHVLTNLPKDLLKYVNIKYELDAANCHPMLFCSILRDYYHIDMRLIYYLLSQIGDNNICSYDSEQLIGLVSQSGYGISIGKSLPEDVIRYIILTFKGMFWDESLKKYKENDRSQIKKEYFGEVFYSHSNDRYIRRKNEETGKTEYIRKEKRIDFEKEYPNVWKVIKEERNKGKRLNKTKNNYLPCKLMQIESTIFQEILRRCYAKGYDVINIHDAIVVVDTKNNESVSSDDIKSIMLEVFFERELYPTLKKEEID